MVLQKHILRGCVTLLVLILLQPESVGATDVQPIRRVLIINEVSTGWPGIPQIDQGIRSAFDTLPYKVEVYREYMDTIYFPDPADQQRFREFYTRKYQNRKLDVIITVGPSPLKFMVQTHNKAFPGVPIIFCLPNWAPGVRPQVEFAGIESDISPVETLDAAFHLNPATKHVVVVGGTSLVDITYNSVIKEKLRPYEAKYGVSYLPSLSMPDLVERLKHLPSDTIVLFTSFSQDAAGSKFTSGGASAIVAAAANVPVFTLGSISIEHGEVGGKLTSLQEQGRLAGELAVRALNGEELEKLPRMESPTKYTFDWRALKRWGFRERDLPPNSIVLDRQPTFWELYRRYVLGGISLVMLEGLLIFGLLWQRGRLRKSDTELTIAFHRLRMAVESGKSVGWDLDVRTGRDHWFGDLQTMFGMASDTFDGTMVDFRRRVHPDDRERVSQAFADARLNRKPYLAEFRVLRDDQTVRWVTARGEFYYAGNGEPVRMLGMATDVTDTKLLEQQVRESEQRFRLLANTAPVMIWTTGTDKLCNYVNRPWLDFTGRTFEQELGNGWAESIHSEDVVSSFRKYTEAFDNREQLEMEYRVRRHDGEYRWIFDRGVPRFNADGSFAGYIGCCIDVTERKRAEEALSTIGRRLIEAHEEERTWIGRELHDDINQRLALLATHVDLLSHENTSKGTAPNRFVDIQKRIRDISGGIQALSHRLHSSKLDYLGLASAAQGFCRELSENAKAEVHFTQSAIPSGIPKEVSLSLFRVLQEALHNAVKYSGVRTFYVNLRGTEDGIELMVLDEGKGFEEQDAFSRQGLGLISMRERIQMVHGVFDIETHPGAGTTIVARVPLQATQTRAKAG